MDNLVYNSVCRGCQGPPVRCRGTLSSPIQRLAVRQPQGAWPSAHPTIAAVKVIIDVVRRLVRIDVVR
jgi:hypothetical protein